MLINELAPQTLSAVYGQDPVKHYFRAIAKRPDAAYRLHLIDGPYGTGKTSIARCFRKELEVLQDPTPVVFYDINASTLRDPQGVLEFKQLLHENFDGYRVILLDEAHLAPPEAQASLLKDIDAIDYPLFLIMATTESSKLIDPLRDRFIDHYLSLFSDAEVQCYISELVETQHIEINAGILEYIISLSGGHLRTAVLQVETLRFLGAKAYVEQMIDCIPLLKELFTTGNAETVDNLSKVPYHILTRQLEQYMFGSVIRAGELFKEHEIPKIFGFYIKHRRYLSSMSDYLSFLLVLAGNIRMLRAGTRQR
jgi:replication-associated recombination protein RarA